MSYMQIIYEDESTNKEKHEKKDKKKKVSCLTCREDNAQSYICALCHNCSEWHR